MIEPIDITSLIPPQLVAFPQIVRSVIPDIAEAVRTEIIRLAHERLHSTSQEYVENVQPVKYHFPTGRMPLTGSQVVAEIVLVGWLPNAVEHGWSGGELMTALLAGRNAKMGKEGPYNVVPFRHGTPRVTGRNMAAMGSQHARLGKMAHDQASAMGRRVHRAAKKLSPTTGGGGAGGRLPPGMSPKLKPHHATDIHAGMMRAEKTYKSKTQSQYFTFRAVSKKSEGKWIHPGLEAHNLFKEGADYTGEIAGHLFEQSLRGASKGGS